MHPDAVLAPAGILEVDGDQLNVVFGTSRDTSDFVADCLELWWANRQAAHPGVRRLLIIWTTARKLPVPERSS